MYKTSAQKRIQWRRHGVEGKGGHIKSSWVSPSRIIGSHSSSRREELPTEKELSIRKKQAVIRSIGAVIKKHTGCVIDTDLGLYGRMIDLVNALRIKKEHDPHPIVYHVIIGRDGCLGLLEDNRNPEWLKKRKIKEPFIRKKPTVIRSIGAVIKKHTDCVIRTDLSLMLKAIDLVNALPWTK